ncbi:hypothetical protein Btru_005188 [Bulinus truncatus]|nr:hypothetical protein Btru_005188 [Bulinus truncatus]
MGSLLGDRLIQWIFEPHRREAVVEQPKVSYSTFHYYLLAMSFICAIFLITAQYLAEICLAELFPSLSWNTLTSRLMVWYVISLRPRNEVVSPVMDRRSSSSDLLSSHNESSGRHGLWGPHVCGSPEISTSDFHTPVPAWSTKLKGARRKRVTTVIRRRVLDFNCNTVKQRLSPPSPQRSC